MKEYESVEYATMFAEIVKIISSDKYAETFKNPILAKADDILDVVKDRSDVINAQILLDNEMLTIKMIEIENATKGYFKKIEEVMK